MRPEVRLGAGIAATLVLAVASFAAHSTDTASTALPSPSSDGSAVFAARGCSGCHTIDGATGGMGPDLTNLAARAGRRVSGLDAEAYVRQSVRHPQTFVVAGYEGMQMPTLLLSDTELDAVVSYLLGIDRREQPRR